MNTEYRKLLNARLQRGIENKEFIIYLQPKFDAKTEKLAGAEALVRWKKNDKIVMPNVFITLFEKYGLITILDNYVLEEVFSIMKSWNEKKYKLVPISVNESRQNLYDKNHLDTLIKYINQYNISPNMIELEMTETTVVNNVELAREAEKNVHKLGFRVSMDDFGTGYSSFSMLKNINIDILKMDKSFFDDILESKRGKIIIESIINMSHKLNIKVVAEGIETKEQVEYLKKDLMEKYQTASQSFAEAEEKDREFLTMFSFICLLSFDVYMKKQLIESIIDSFPSD